jgi:branched-chain amino acid transport system substrate-binding protein
VEWLLARKAFQPRTRKILFIVEDTDYGRSNAKATIKRFEEIGWSALPVETFPLEHSDFGPQLNKLQETEVDLLIAIFTPVAEGAALVEQFEELGVSALHIAIYYPGEPDFLQL